MKLVLLIIVTSLTILSCKNTSREEPDPRIMTLPIFNLKLLTSGETFNTSKIPPGKKTVILYFSPDCTYSREQLNALTSCIDSLKNTSFYLLTPIALPKLQQFYVQYNLNKYSNIIVGQDYEAFFSKELNIKSYPWTLIYNTDRRLKKIIVGVASEKLIKELINT